MAAERYTIITISEHYQSVSIEESTADGLWYALQRSWEQKGKICVLPAAQAYQLVKGAVERIGRSDA